MFHVVFWGESSKKIYIYGYINEVEVAFNVRLLQFFMYNYWTVLDLLAGLRFSKDSRTQWDHLDSFKGCFAQRWELCCLLKYLPLDSAR